MHKTKAYSKVPLKVVKPSPEQKTLARSIIKAALNPTNKQPDLLYVEGILVTEGVNGNDDAFLREELWNARSTPLLKPINWQHNDEDTLGVVYHVEARGLNGSLIEGDQIPEGPFEFVVHGAVWHYLPHLATTSAKIRERVEAGNLFLSMECWFDNFDYALFDDNEQLIDVIERNADRHLDAFLRVRGGAGKFEGKRISRALKNIVFGGVGLVDKPANPRSDILEILDGSVTDNVVKDEVSLNEDASFVNEEEVMADNKNFAIASEEAEKVARKVLADDRKEREAEQMKAELSKAEQEVEGLKSRVNALETELKEAYKAVDEAFAGATENTPSEIAKIDAAHSGQEKFNAKIAWIAESRAKAFDSDELETLRAENRELKAAIREAEVKSLLAGILSEEELEAFVTNAKDLTNEQYETWLVEKKIMAVKHLDKEKVEDEEKEKAGYVGPRDMRVELKDYDAVLKRQGKGPKGDVPLRHKLAGSIDEGLSETDLEDLLESPDEPNLAGSTPAEENPNVMAGLVSWLRTDNKRSKKNEGGN